MHQTQSKLTGGFGCHETAFQQNTRLSWRFPTVLHRAAWSCFGLAELLPPDVGQRVTHLVQPTAFCPHPQCSFLVTASLSQAGSASPTVSLSGTSWSNTPSTIQPILHWVTSLYISAGTDLGGFYICVHLHRALLHHPELSTGVIWHYHLLPTGCYCHTPSHFLKYWLLETTLQHQLPPKITTEPQTSYNDCMLSYHSCWHQLMPWITTQPLTSADSHTSPHRSHQQ